MKRNFKLLVAVLVLVVMVFTLASCDKIQGIVDKFVPHEHEFSAEWSSDATNHWHAATCDKKDECSTATADVAAHDFKEGTCSVCGYKNPDYVAPECEHAYGTPEITKEPTCNEKGEKKFTCLDCGYSYTAEVASKGHTEELIPFKAPTCTEPGHQEGTKCSVCDEIITEPEVIGVIAHEYADGLCKGCYAIDPSHKGSVTYTLGVQSMEAVTQGQKNNGDSATFFNYFTIYYSEKFKLDTSSKTFDDGFKATQRLNWGAGTSVKYEVTKKDDNGNEVKDEAGNPIIEATYIRNAIEFVVPEGYTASVKVWWVSGGTYKVKNAEGVEVEIPRQIGIYDEDNNVVVQTDVEIEKNALAISELTLSEAGKYYLGNVGNTNYFFEVAVTLTPVATEPEVPTSGSIDVTITDNNCWNDKASFTATQSGKYTFTLPAGIGAMDAYALDNDDWSVYPYFDYNSVNDPSEKEIPHSFEVEIAAGDTYEFYVMAPNKDVVVSIQWSVVPGEVEGGDDNTDDPIESDKVVLGSNTISSDKTYTFEVTVADIYTFDSNGSLLTNVFNANGENVGSNKVELAVGTYTISFWSPASEPANYTLTIFGSADEGDDLDITGTYVDGEGVLAVIIDETTVTFQHTNPMTQFTNTLVANYTVVNGTVVLTDPESGNAIPAMYSITLEDGVVVGCVHQGFPYDLAEGEIGGGEGGEGGDPVIPSEPDGSANNPYVIEEIPTELAFEGEHDIYYTYTATEAVTLKITYLEGTYVSILGGYWEKDETNLCYILEIEANETVTINPFSTISGAYEITVYTASGEEGGEGDGEDTCDHWGMYDNEKSVEATCKTDGLEVISCFNCGEVISETVIPASKDHCDWQLDNATYKAPTCKDNGYKFETCSVCGDTKETTLNAAEWFHNYQLDEEQSVAPTCTEAGKEVEVCTYCGDTRSFDVDPIHDFVYSSNYSVITCSACDLMYFSAQFNATETFAYTIALYSSANGPVVNVYNDNIDEYFAYVIAPAVDGVYTLTLTANGNDTLGLCNGTVTVKPAYGGIYVTITLADGTVLEYNNDTHEHEYGDEGVVTEPTCTEAGYTTYTCACGDSYTEAGEAATGHSYDEGICSACGAEDPNHYFVVTIPEALEAADGKKVEVSGTVCTINTAWSDSYGNICVTIVDANGDELYIYRLKTNVALGDIITVKGVMATYNGRQIGAGATATITDHDSSYDYTEMTIPEAIAAADNTNVIVTGTVIKIGTAYSSQYNNISVTIADDEGNQLYLYRLTGNVTVGQIIKVKGSMATYNGRQVTGGTFEAVGTHTCSKYTEATCAKLSACVVCGATTGELADHNYVDGLCTVCNGVDPDYEGEVVAPKTTTISIVDYADANGWENSKEYTSIVMNDNITVSISNSGGTNSKYYTSGENLRLYTSSNSTSTITVTGNNVTIVSVKITYVVSDDGVLQHSGSSVASDTAVTVNASSTEFTVKDGNGAKSWGQVRITAIEVVYQ